MTVQLDPNPGADRRPATHHTSLATFEDVAARWDELAERLDAPPFHRPGWYGPWAAAFAPGRLRVLTVTRRGHLVGVLPVVQQRGRLRSATNGHSVSTGAIVADDDALRALVRGVASGRHGSVFLDRLAIPEASLPTWEDELTRGSSDAHVRPGDRTSVTDLTWSPEDLQRRLTASQRRDITRCRRRADAVGEVRFDERGADEPVLTAFAACLDVEAAGWKGREGTAIASLPATRAFYEQVVAWAADRGWLRIHRMSIDGELAAFQLSTVHAGKQYMLKCGYDERFASVGPGKLLDHHLVMGGASDPSLVSCDWQGDGGRHTQMWGMISNQYHQLTLYARNVNGFLLHGGDEAVRRTSDWARDHLSPALRAQLRSARARLEDGGSAGAAGPRPRHGSKETT